MIALTWRTLLTGGVRSVVTMVVLAIGAFLLAFTGITSATMTAALSAGIEAPYAGSDIVITTTPSDGAGATQQGANEISAEDAQVLGEIDGVRQVTGFVSTHAIVRAGDRIRGLTVESLPTDPSAAWQRLNAGAWPASTDEIALSRHTLDELGLSVGDRVVFGKKDIGPGTFTITGDIDTRGALDHQNNSYGVVTPEIAHVLAGVTGYTDLHLTLAPGTDANAVLSEVNRLVPEVWPITTDELVGGTESIFGMGVSLLRNVVIGLIAVSLIVTAMVLATVYGASLAGRSRLLALQRCVGATRAQVMGSVVSEAALLAVAGGLIGVLLAVGTAWALLPLLGELVSEAAVDHFTVPWEALVMPIGAVVALAVLASLLPAWRASRVSPTRALGTSVETPAAAGSTVARVAAGVAVLLVGAVALVTGTQDAEPIVTTLGIAATGLSLVWLSRPAYCGVAAVIAALARRLKHAPTELVGENIRRNPRRSAALGLSVTVAAVVTMTAWTALDSARTTIHERISETPSVDLTVGDVSSSEIIDTESLQAMTDLAGVERVLAVEATGDITMTGTAAPASGDTGEIVTDEATPGSDTPTQISWNVAVARVTADELAEIMRVPYDLAATDDQTVYLPAGRHVPFDAAQPVTVTGPLGSATVAVTYVEGLDLPAFVSPALYDRLTATREVRSAWIAIDRATDQGLLMDRIRAEAVLAGDQRVGGALPSTLRLDAALSLVRTTAISLLAAAMLVALIGLAATTALTIAERRHENAVVRALGLEREQLRRTLLAESIALGLTGTVLGAGLGVAYGLAIAVGVGDALDLRTVTSVPGIALLFIVAVPVIVLYLTTDSVAEKASRVQPAHALIPR
ncbi:MAG: FtsX-like permease family protein [Aeromicrobium sp.]|uniref:ABC transporter permease n=1 Tax=Aeromicrobium sp. TaxID=1871063 RepID=UPI0039E3ECBF